MKKFTLGAAALSMVLALAGCSSNSDSSKTSSATSTEQSSQTTESQTSAQATGDYASLKNSFINKGFTIQDESQDGNILNFTAANDSGDVHAKAERFASPEDTLQVYYNEVAQLQNEGYVLVNAWTDDRGELSELTNTTNNVYALVGAQKESCEVYTLQDILEGDYDTCKSILQEQGCPLK